MKRYRSRCRLEMSALLTGELASSSSRATLTAKGNLLAPSMQKWAGHRALLPTLTATRYGSTNNGCPKDGRENYATAGTPSLDTLAVTGGGTLSPTWCEWFMGFPRGWVTLDGPLAMLLSPNAPRSSAGSSGS